jgi:hypothetical protein
MSFFNTDNVPASRADSNVNRCDADVSLSVRGCFRINRNVLNFPSFLPPRALTILGDPVASSTWAVPKNEPDESRRTTPRRLSLAGLKWTWVLFTSGIRRHRR